MADVSRRFSFLAQGLLLLISMPIVLAALSVEEMAELDARNQFNGAYNEDTRQVAVEELTKAPLRKIIFDYSHHLNEMQIEQKNPVSAEAFKEKSFTEKFKFTPGTKWCGPGTKARHVDDLGNFNLLDSCCREHDFCKRSIKGVRIMTKTSLDRKPSFVQQLPGNHSAAYEPHHCNRYSLPEHEYYEHTISDCECDNKFRNCLHNVIRENFGTPEAVAAKLTGVYFFNIEAFKCLTQDSNSMWFAKQNPSFDSPPAIFGPRQPVTKAPTTPTPTPQVNRVVECRDCSKLKYIGSCEAPQRGEYREIIQQATDTQIWRDFTRIFVRKEKLLAMSICNHPMKNHCKLPENACGANLTTHSGEPNVVIVFL